MLVVAGIVTSSVVLAAVLAGLGPSRYVVCGTGHTLDRLAQAVMQPLGAGRTDGPRANYCVVPSITSWLLAAITFVVMAGGSLVAMSLRRPGS